MKKVVYSVFIDIPEDKLDNPGWFENDVQVKTDKSLQTKNALKENYDGIVARQKQYAESIGADYHLYEMDDYYKDFVATFEQEYPEVLPHISSCKSPQQMFGTLAKTYYAKTEQYWVGGERQYQQQQQRPRAAAGGGQRPSPRPTRKFPPAPTWPAFRFVKRCAMRWPRKCAATSVFS